MSLDASLSRTIAYVLARHLLDVQAFMAPMFVVVKDTRRSATQVLFLFCSSNLSSFGLGRRSFESVDYNIFRHLDRGVILG